jgi:two-component system sensor histidine kinase BaeS
LVLTESGALKYQKVACDLGEVVARSLARFEQQFKDAAIDVILQLDDLCGRQIWADPHRIRQVLDNVFKNTLRYTDKGGQFVISADVTDRIVTLNFQDTYPGVGDEDIDKLFDRLYRVEKSRNRATGGAGLGLAVCKSIVGEHAGDISATHSPLGGLWIKLSLPLLQQSEQGYAQ